MTEQEVANNNFISLADAAAKYTEHSQEYLSLRARQGKLKAVKFGRNWLTKKDWVDEYIASVNSHNNKKISDTEITSLPNQTIQEPEYISLKDAETYSGYSQEYLSLRARQGKLKAVKFGRNWLTKKDWVDEYKAEIDIDKNKNEQRLKIKTAPIRVVKKLLFPGYLSFLKKYSEKVFYLLVSGFQELAFVLKTKKAIFIAGTLLIFCSTGLVFGYPYAEDFIQPFRNFVSENSQKIKKASDVLNAFEFSDYLEKSLQRVKYSISEKIEASENLETVIERMLRVKTRALANGIFQQQEQQKQKVKNFVEQLAAGWQAEREIFKKQSYELFALSQDIMKKTAEDFRVVREKIFYAWQAVQEKTFRAWHLFSAEKSEHLRTLGNKLRVNAAVSRQGLQDLAVDVYNRQKENFINSLVDLSSNGQGLLLSFDDVQRRIKKEIRNDVDLANDNWHDNWQAVFSQVNQWGDIFASRIEDFSSSLMENTTEGTAWLMAQVAVETEDTVEVIAQKISSLTKTTLSNFQEATRLTWEKIKFSGDIIDNKIIQGFENTLSKLKFLTYNIYSKTGQGLKKSYKFVISPWSKDGSESIVEVGESSQVSVTQPLETSQATESVSSTTLEIGLLMEQIATTVVSTPAGKDLITQVAPKAAPEGGEPRQGRETVKEIIKEVKTITQIQPIKEITREVLRIDDASLVLLKAQIVELKKYYDADIKNLQELLKKIQAQPPVYSLAAAAPIYVGSTGIQIGGGANLASLGVSGSAGINDLAVGGSAVIGQTSGNLLTVNSSADFLADVTLRRNVSILGGLTVSGSQSGGTVSFVASSTSPIFILNQTGSGQLVQFKDAGNIVFEIVDGGALTLTSTSSPQFKVAYDGLNYFTINVSSVGSALLTSTAALNLTGNGTSTWQIVSAPLTIKTDTSGDILLSSAGNFTEKFATSSAYALYQGETVRLAINTAGNLTLTASSTIALTGNTTITGNTTTTGNLFVGGNATSSDLYVSNILTAGYLNVSGTTTIAANLIPATTNTHNLGTTNYRWNQGWFNTLNIGTSTWSINQPDNQRLSFWNSASGTGVEKLTITQTGYLGIATSSPSALLAITGTSTVASLAIASSSGASMLTLDQYGNLGLATSSPVAKFAVDGNTYFRGNTTTTGNLFVGGNATTSGDYHIGGNLQVNGNSIVLGTSSTGYLVVNSAVASNFVPDQNAVRNLGSAAYFWNFTYTGTLVANNIEAASTTIGGTASANFVLNSDNITEDTEGANLIFFRGTVVPNALITWDSTADRFDINQPFFIQNDSSTTTVVSLDIRGKAGQTANLFRVSSSSEDILFNITSDGLIGVGTDNPSYPLDVGATTTIVSGGTQAQNTSLVINPTATSSANYYGAMSVADYQATYGTNSGYFVMGNWGEARNSNTATLENVVGGWFRAANTSSGTINDAYGVVGQARNSGSGTMVRGYGTVGAARNNSTGSIADAVGVYGDIINANAGGAITNAYNLRAAVPYSNAGTITNLYGVYIDAQSPTGGGTITNKWALYQAGSSDKSYFAGNIGLGTTTPATKLDVYGSLQVGTSTTPVITPLFMVNTGSATVGIGTSTPSAKFSIVGTANTTALNIASSSGSSMLTLDQYGNLGLATSSPAYQMDILGKAGLGSLHIASSSGSSMFVINEYGNAGIGTSSSSAKLEVAGNKDATQFIVRANSSQSNTNPLIKLLSSGGAELVRIHSDNANNLFVGVNTGRVNNVSGVGSQGLFNAFIGANAGYSNTTGYQNAALGANALYSNTIGYTNSAMGFNALFFNTTGYQNAALGASALYSNTIGYTNAAVGSSALYSNTTGYANAALGVSALLSNTTGYDNLAAGNSALLSNTTGYSNVALGSYALFGNLPTSKAITAFADAGGGNTTVTSEGHGLSNGATVQISGTTNYNGSYTISNVTADTFRIVKTFVADDATGWWGINAEGRYNVALGANAGRSNTTGSGNTFIGYNAGYTGTSANLTNATCLGYECQVAASNSLILGGTGSNAVNVGLGTTTPATKLDVYGSLQVGTSTTPTITPLFIANTGSATVGIGTSTPSAKFAIAGTAGVNALAIASSSGASMLVLDPYGNIGIGTSSPSQKLYVEGQCVTGDTLLPIGRNLKSKNENLKSTSKILNLFEYIQIKDVQPGDYVLSLNEKTGKLEPAKIKGLLDMGIKPIYEMETEDGRKIRTTENHPYLAKLKVKSEKLKVESTVIKHDLASFINPSAKINASDVEDTLFAEEFNSYFTKAEPVSGLSHSDQWFGKHHRIGNSHIVVSDFAPDLTGEFRSEPLETFFRLASNNELMSHSYSTDTRPAAISLRASSYSRFSSFLADLSNGQRDSISSTNLPTGFFSYSPSGKESANNSSILQTNSQNPRISNKNQAGRFSGSRPIMAREFLGKDKPSACLANAEKCAKLGLDGESDLVFDNVLVIQDNDNKEAQELSTPLENSSLSENESLILHNSLTGSNAEWVEVYKLKIGDEIAVADFNNFQFSVFNFQSISNDLIFKQENADFGDIKFVKIKSITQLPPEQVYDIEVEGTHNFVAGHLMDENTGEVLSPEQETEYLKIQNSKSPAYRRGRQISNKSQIQNSNNPEKFASQINGASQNIFEETVLDFEHLDFENCLELGACDLEFNDEVVFAGIIAHNTYITSTTTIAANLIPATTNTHNLGTTLYRWNQGWFNTLNIGTSTWSLNQPDNQRLSFWNSASGTGVEKLTISQTGYLGLATSSPSALLAITGTSTVVSLNIASSTGASMFILDQYGNLGIATSAPAYQMDILGKAGLGSLHIASSTGAGVFAVDQYGRVGVGTVTPLYTLHVAGQCVTGDTRLRRRRKRVQSSKFKVQSYSSELKVNEDEEYIYDEVAIKDIQAGDEIQSLDEKTGKLVWSKVKALMDMGVKPIYTLQTADGRKIRTTGNHPYLIKDTAGRPIKHQSVIKDTGWITAENIREGDYLAVPKPRVGVFIDDANMFYAQKKAGWRVDYKKLKEILERQFEVVFMNYELAIPSTRDSAFLKTQKFLEVLKEKYGDILTFKEKHLKYILDHETGERKKKGNLDAEIISGVFGTFDKLDAIAVVSGDSDFAILGKEALERNKKIFFVGFENNMAWELRQMTHLYLNRIRNLVEAKSETAVDGQKEKAPVFEPGVPLLLPVYSDQEILSSPAVDKSDFVWARVASVEQTPAEQVYDIEVEGTHNFIGNGIVAHNTYINASNATGNSLDLDANSLTSGYGLDVSSSATGLTGNLGLFTLSGSNAANTGSVLRLDNTGTLNTNTTFYIDHRAAGTGNLALRVDDESGDTTPFVIDGAGQVGIGTTTPATKLDVWGSLQVGTSTTPTITPLFIANTGSATVGIGTSTPSAKFAIAGTAGVNALAIASSSGASMLVLDQYGRVGVGIATPLYTLHVAGQCVTGDTRLRRRRKRTPHSISPPKEGGDKEGDSISPFQRGREEGVEDDDYIYDEVEIKDIQPGDEVLTLNEASGKMVWSKVEALWDMGTKPIYKLTTASGKTIRTTAEHPYLVLQKQKDGFEYDTNFLFNHFFEDIFKTVKSFYFDVLIKESVSVTAFDGEKVFFTRSGWQHLFEKDRSRLNFISRLFALPKAVAALSCEEVQPTYEKRGNKEFWAFRAIVDDVLIKVVVRSVNEGKKHFFSVVWQGEQKNQPEFKADLTIENETMEQQKRAVSRLYPRCRGREQVLTPQLQIQYNRFAEILSRGELNQKDRPTVTPLDKSQQIRSRKRSIGSSIAKQDSLSSPLDVENYLTGSRADGKWTKVAKLAVGDQIAVAISATDEPDLVKSSVQFEKIAKIEQLPEEPVYDITVQGTHNFVANGIIAHNTYITATTTIAANLVPSITNTYNVGTTLYRWNEGWFNAINIGTSTWSLNQPDNQRLSFWNSASGTGVEKLTITQTGYLGIATSSPSALLAITGTSTVASLNIASSSGAAMLTLDQYGNAGISTSTPTAKLAILGTAGLASLNIASSSGASMLLVNQYGNVGIATSSPTAKLAIAGTAGLASLHIASSTGAAILTVNEYGNMVVKLGDASGNQKLTFTDSQDAVLFTVNSDGVVQFNQRTTLTDNATTFDIVPADGDYVRIGDATTTQYSLGTDGLLVSDDLEVAGLVIGQTQFDRIAGLDNAKTLHLTMDKDYVNYSSGSTDYVFGQEGELGTFTEAFGYRSLTPTALTAQKAISITQSDNLQYTRGSLQGGDGTGVVYENFDPNQGTLEFWVRPNWNGNDGVNHYIFNILSSDGYIWLRKNNVNYWEMNYKIGGIQYTAAQIATGVTAGNWYHIIGVWSTNENVSGSNKIALYVNAGVNASAGITTKFSLLPTTFQIGSYFNNTLQFNGVIAGRILNRPLTSTEVSTNYASGAGHTDTFTVTPDTVWMGTYSDSDTDDVFWHRGQAVQACTATTATLVQAVGSRSWKDNDRVAVWDGTGYKVEGLINEGGGIATTDTSLDLDNLSSANLDKVGVGATSTAASTQYFVKTSPVNLNIVDDYSVSAWIKTSVSGLNQTIYNKDGANNLGLMLRVTNTGLLNAHIYNNAGGGASYMTINSTKTVTDGKWHQVGFTYDDAPTPTLIVYVDGYSDGSSTTILAGTKDTGNGTVYIGSVGAIADYYFNGSLRDVAAWTSLLTAGNMLTLATIPLSESGLSPTSWWSFTDAATDTTITDDATAGNANHLTLVGGTTTNYGTHSRTQQAFISKNLIADGGMEQGGIGAWTELSADDNYKPTLAKNTSTVSYDTRSLRATIHASGVADDGIAQTISVTNGGDYLLRGNYRVASGDTWNLNITNGGGDVYNLTQTDWTVPFETAFEASATSATINFHATAASDDIYLDQVQLYNNLVDNGGMEGTYVSGVAPGWLTDSWSVEDNLNEHSGSKSQRSIDDSSLFRRKHYQTINLIQGKYYTFSIWVTGAAGDKMSVYLNSIDATQNLWTFNTNGILQKFSGTFQVNGSDTSGDFEVWPTDNNASSTGIIYFDDVSLIELDQDDPSTTGVTTPSTSANSFGTGKWSDSNGALIVDGADTLTYPQSGNISNSAGTVSFWVYPSGYDEATPVDKFWIDTRDSTPDQGFSIKMDATNDDVTFAGNDSTNTWSISSAGIDWTANTWYHVAATYDCSQSAGSDAVILYINGASAASDAAETCASWTLPTNFYLNADYAGSNQGDAFIDDFRAYNELLTADQVKALYQSKDLKRAPGASKLAMNTTAVQSGGTDTALTVTQAGQGASAGMIITNLGTGLSFRVNDELNDTTPFVVDASGNVGIGDTTPSYTLDVAGTGRFTSNLYLDAGLYMTTGGIYVYGASSKVVMYDDKIFGFGGGAGTQDVSMGYVSSDDTFRIAKGTDLTTTPRITLDTNGNVGIGTTTPATKLDVWGSLQVGTSTTPTITPLFIANAVLNMVGIGTSTPNAKFAIVGVANTASIQVASTTGATMLYLGQYGNLSLGNVSPGSRLDIVENRTAGTIINVDYEAATTLTGNVSGINLDLSANVTPGSYNITGFQITTPSAGTGDLTYAKFINGSDTLYDLDVTTAQFNVPVSFNSAGDVSLAYDLVLTNGTAGYITFNGPGYIRTDDASGNYDLTLSAANLGKVIISDNLQHLGETEFTATTTQTVSTTTAIVVGNATHIVVTATSSVVLSSAPTIADGTTGQVVILRGASTTATVTVQDQDTLASSNLQLGSTSRQLGNGDTLALMFNGTDWVELWFSGGIDADYAEMYKIKEDVETGDVVSFTEERLKVGKAKLGDETVAGIISGQPAYLIGQEFREEMQMPVALEGRVPVKISLEAGEIKKGDLLVPSSKPGLAMKFNEEYIASVILNEVKDLGDSSPTAQNDTSVIPRSPQATEESQIPIVGIALEDYGTSTLASEFLDTTYKIYKVKYKEGIDFADVNRLNAKYKIKDLSADYLDLEKDSGWKVIEIRAEYEQGYLQSPVVETLQWLSENIIRQPNPEFRIIDTDSDSATILCMLKSGFARVSNAAGLATKLTVVEKDGKLVVQVIGQDLPNFGLEILSDGTIRVAKLLVDELQVGSSEKRTGVTLYDEDTGEPYCLKMKAGAMISSAGKCAEQPAPLPAVSSIVPEPSLEPEPSSASVIPRSPQATEEPQPTTAATEIIETAVEPQDEQPEADTEQSTEQPGPSASSPSPDIESPTSSSSESSVVEEPAPAPEPKSPPDEQPAE